MKSRTKKIKNLILGILTVLLALAMALLPVLLRSSKAGETDAASILNTTVERRSIRSTISGGGALTGADAKKISLPKGVELTRYLVKNGQNVEEGQPLAAVDKTSVMKTIAVVQKNLEYLDSQMNSTPAARTSETLSSPVSGRVKAVYAQTGSSVADVITEKGALAVISLDGRMAVQLETLSPAAVGEEVTVTLSDGKTVPGRVERRQEDLLTITMTDNGPALGERVKVTTADGTELGQGELYVHSAWNLCAVSGVVKKLYIRTGDMVHRGNGLCYLEEMDGNGRLDQLSQQRRDYEQTLEQLFSLYDSGTIPAPEAGIVAGVDTDKLGLLRAGEEEFQVRLLGAMDESELPPEPHPDHTPPSDFRNKAAFVSSVSYGSIGFMTNSDYIPVSSYVTPTEPDYTQLQPLTIGSFAGVTVYRFDPEAGSWETVGPDALELGQTVYLVYDDAEVLRWVLLPHVPEEEIDVYPGGGGGGAAPFEMYDLTQTEIMRLSPWGDMTVQVKIDEMDVLYVAPGQEAEVTVDALPGRSFVGHVREIDPQGVNSGGRTRYTVTITVDREEELLSGMNATAILTVGITEDVLTLPVAALDEKGSRTVVYTGCDPQTRELLAPVEVETGISDGVSVEIVSGLSEGQEVYYTYYETAAMPELSALPGSMT